MTEITVLGPNGIKGHTFHVHRRDCADIKRSYPGVSRAEIWNGTFKSEREGVLDLFGDFIDENGYTDDEAYDTYENEVRFFPCIIWES